MSLKQQILFRYRQLVQDQIDIFQDMIADLAEGAQNDAKSSAGDKHETALSMMQLEQEKLSSKLKEILIQKGILDKIDVDKPHFKVVLGSLVKTNGLWLFVSTALPKISIQGKIIFAISSNSPLGINLLGNEVGHTFEVNGKKYVIEEVS